jgi:hypothetical protein
MVPSVQIIKRTLMIYSTERKGGTAFVVHIDGDLYLITAKHIFDGAAIDRLYVKKHDRDTEMTADLVLSPYGSDFAFARLAESVTSEAPPLTLGTTGSLLGEDVYVIGFPLGLSQDGSLLNAGLPLPVVAKCTLSAMYEGKILLHGVLDEGYSGSPVILARGLPERAAVIGMVSHNLKRSEDVPGRTIARYASIVGCLSIDWIVEEIRKHANQNRTLLGAIVRP